MLTKEKIAHDLSMAYLYNRHGIDLKGSFSVGGGGGGDSIYGSGDLKSVHYAGADDVLTEERDTGSYSKFGPFKFTKYESVEVGKAADYHLVEIYKDYKYAFEYFMKIIND